jgi:type II secretory pathway component PulM
MLADLIILVVLAVAVFVITGPLRRERAHGAEARENRIAELEAARESKYLEIRDAEMDLRTGKLSEEDYQAVDRALRAEAIEIMRALDVVQARETEPSAG